MSDLPKTRYAKSGEVHIAYQVLGDGPIDLLWVPGFVSHLEYDWEHPRPGAVLSAAGLFFPFDPLR